MQQGGMPMARLGLTLTVLAAVACASSALAQNDEQFFAFQDWHVRSDSVDTGEDLRTLCRMWTGGDGMPTLAVEISDGDALPPDFYPGASVEETAVRGYSTVLQDGETVTFVFDTGERIPALVRAGISDEGFAIASSEFAEPDKLRALKAMRASGGIDILASSGVFYHASLSGFTAAYGKLAEQCGFTTVGVVD
jgi:hypothetical protein